MFGNKKCPHSTISIVVALIIIIIVSAVTSILITKSGYLLKAGHSWNKVDYTAKTQAMADMTFEEWQVTIDKKVQAMHDNADTLAGQNTEENFKTMQEISRLKQEGDMKGVKALMADSDMFGFADKTGYKMGGHWKK